MVNNYPNEQAAARALLGESVTLLKQAGIDFVVLGGWLPFLFNQGQYSHPGTFDVDIVFNGRLTKVQVDCAAELMEHSGYLPAAKNRFQLYRIFNTNGKDTVYHVDFLHRLYAPDQEDFMLSHWNTFQSIAGPGTDIIFLFDERTQEKMTFPDATGRESPVVVDFVSEVGFLAAKGRSLASPKRIRDAFDIFLVIAQTRDRLRLVNRSTELMKQPMFAVSLKKIRKEFNNGNAVMNTMRFLPRGKMRDPEDTDEIEAHVKTTVNNFLDEVGVPAMEQVATDAEIAGS